MIEKSHGGDMKNLFLLVLALVLFFGCGNNDGIRMIEIDGGHKVWTKKIGNNPDIKLLLLHGGPGATHEYFKILDQYLPQENIEYYYYDQFGSFNSDPSNNPTDWTIDRFVEEVETVRKKLGLTPSNFYLLGHSWGGLLAMEYALKYQQNIKGLIISNMMASIPDYNDFASNVLGPQMPPEVLAEIREFEESKDYGNPRYMELLIPHHYEEHVLRIPADKWPEEVNNAFANKHYKLIVKKNYTLNKPLVIYNITNKNLTSNNLNLRFNILLEENSYLKIIDFSKMNSKNVISLN